MNRRNFLKRSTIVLVGATLADKLASPVLRATPDDPESFEGESVFRRLMEEAEKENWKEKPIG